jgi:hypothetical protein
MWLVKTIVGFPTTFGQFKAKYDRCLDEGHPELAGRLALTYAGCNFTYSREIGQSYLLAAEGFLGCNDFSRSYEAAECASWVFSGATLAHDYVEPAHNGEPRSSVRCDDKERAAVLISQCKSLMSYNEVCRTDEIVRGLILNTPRMGPLHRFKKIGDWVLTRISAGVRTSTPRRGMNGSSLWRSLRRQAGTPRARPPGRSVDLTPRYPAAKGQAAA